jgi:outer membrane protein assembly factor BamB
MVRIQSLSVMLAMFVCYTTAQCSDWQYNLGESESMWATLMVQVGSTVVTVQRDLTSEQPQLVALSACTGEVIWATPVACNGENVNYYPPVTAIKVVGTNLKRAKLIVNSHGSMCSNTTAYSMTTGTPVWSVNPMSLIPGDLYTALEVVPLSSGEQRIHRHL